MKYKARIVAKGYIELQGIDFNEVFAPVTRLETLQIIHAFTTSNGLSIHHLDVQSTFLNGNLYEEVYVTQLQGFVKKDKLKLGYKMEKVLYCLGRAR